MTREMVAPKEKMSEPTVICEYPLPGNPSVKVWQTKDLAGQSNMLKITVDGQVCGEVYDTEDRKRWEAAPYFGGFLNRRRKRNPVEMVGVLQSRQVGERGMDNVIGPPSVGRAFDVILL